MTYTDEEIRHMAIELLIAKTDRDKQTRIGASNLSNPCDYCLAANFMGDDRSTPITSRAWMGARLGTAMHSLWEERAKMVEGFLEQYPDAKQEEHVFFAELRGYGKIGGSIDLLLPDGIVDWKGSTRKKSLLMLDYLQMSEGLEPRFGRAHKDIKLSEKVYAEEMEKQASKVTGYYGQQTLYMHGSGRKRASLVFFNRDGTGWFDMPAADRYEDPSAVHDVWVLSFDYDQAYAEALIARGQAIWDHLEAGGQPSDFERNAMCFPCGLDGRDEAKASVPDVDIEARMGMAA
jgi:hypothetical protein